MFYEWRKYTTFRVVCGRESERVRKRGSGASGGRALPLGPSFGLPQRWGEPSSASRRDFVRAVFSRAVISSRGERAGSPFHEVATERDPPSVHYPSEPPRRRLPMRRCHHGRRKERRDGGAYERKSENGEPDCMRFSSPLAKPAA